MVRDLPQPHDLSSHSLSLRRFARALCREPSEAEDVSQDVLLAAVQRGSAGAIWPGWLRVTGRNVARARRRGESRRRRREASYARQDAVPSAAERAMRLELEERLVSCLRALPDKQSEALYLRFWEDLPPREIAARLGVSNAAVKTRLKRGLAALRTRLDDETDGGRDEWMGALGVAAGGVIMKKSIVSAAVVVLGAGLWVAWPDAEVVLEAPAPLTPSLDRPVVTLGSPDPGSSARESVGAPAQEPLLEGRAVVVGRVLDRTGGGDTADDVPAVGARVQLSRFALGSEIPTTTTDDEGRFRFEVELDWEGQRTFQLVALGDDDQRSAHHHVRLVGEESAVENIDLVRHAHGGLHGTTVDVSGAALGGVEVAVTASGRDVATTVSGEDGVFHFAKVHQGGGLDGRLAGWSVIDADRAQQNEDGSWNDARVVLCETGVLRVRVEDDRGEPLEDVRVNALASPAERYGTERGSQRIGRSASHSATTHSDGVAVFSEVYGGLKLRLEVYTGANVVGFEHEVEGVAIAGRTVSSSRPIFVPPGAERALTIRMAANRRVTGHVLTADRAPMAGAHVKLRSAETRIGSPSFVMMTTQADADGWFELDVRTFETAGMALLSASDSRGHFFSWSEDDAPVAASLAIDLTRDHEDVTIVVQPTSAITGRVLGPDDVGLSARLRVTPVEGQLVHGHLSTGFRDSALAKKDGAFTLAGLPEGRFDVLVEHSEHAPVLLEGVAAGTHGLVVRLDEPPAATVTIEVVAEGCELDQVIVLRGNLRPWQGTSVDAPLLTARAVYSDPQGWPESALGLWYGSEGETLDVGSCLYDYWPIEGTTKTVGVSPGYHWFGAKARSKDGELLFPVGTGLVEVAEGEHHLRFELRRTGSVEGRVSGVPAGAGWHAAIAHTKGELVPLDIRRDTMSSTAELGAGGDFYFESVPGGTFELRVGPPSELREGGSRGRQSVEVRAGETTRLDIDLR